MTVLITFFSQSDFKCGNGFCIRNDNWCDGIDHCGDGSDEARCDEPCLKVTLGTDLSFSLDQIEDPDGNIFQNNSGL